MSTNEELYLGIDVSKDSICVCLYPQNEVLTVNNEPRDISKWIKTLPKGIELAVMEATGCWEETVAAQLHAAGIPVCIMNPHRIRSFAIGAGQLAKTDKIDAKIIAFFASVIKPTPQKLPDEQEAALKELVIRRIQIVDLIVIEKNHLLMAKNKIIKKDIEKNIKWLTKNLTEINLKIKTMVKNSPIWSEKEKILTSVKGVGPVTSSVLIATLPELGTITGKEISSLVGLAPITRQSGKWSGISFTLGGRKKTRDVLYMAALSAIRSNAVIKEFYQRLIANGKPFKIAITACMRKLLTILNALLRDNSLWRLA